MIYVKGDKVLRARYYFAMECVKKAADVLKAAGFENVEITQKTSHQDLVTPMDSGIETMIRQWILEQYPDDLVIGEESSYKEEAQNSGSSTWYLDPIDGTTNYVNIHKNFSISLAYSKDDTVIFGIVYDVMNSRMYHAYLGEGAFINSEPLQTLSAVPLSEAILTTPVVNHTFLDDHELKDGCISLSSSVRGVRSMGCVSLELCELAEGGANICIAMRSGPWDHNAAALIVKEAGGYFRPLLADDLSPRYSGPIFASTDKQLAQITYQKYFNRDELL